MELTPEFERKLGMIKALGADVELNKEDDNTWVLIINNEASVFNDIRQFEELIEKTLHEVRNRV